MVFLLDHRLCLLVLCSILLADIQVSHAQRYIDPIQVRYMQGFQQQGSPATPFNHLWIGSDLPLPLSKDRFLLFSPFYEEWNLDSADTEAIYPPLRSLGLPVGVIIPLQDPKWTLTFIPFVRTNGEKLFADNTFQLGGVALATIARKPKQKFRFGVYASAEFFGLFVVPLLGCDWRLDDRNYLFGVLPGRMSYEHQFNKRLYGGVTFRAPTNSFRLQDGSFVRLDDNQLSLFTDVYLFPQFCLTFEAGIGVFRRLRTGINTHEYITNEKWGDSPFIRLSASYRINLESMKQGA